jgi:addiction module HigA family antidote
MAKTVSVQSPGSYLTQLLEKNDLNPFKISKDIALSQSAVRLIVLGKTRISVPVALRLAKYFNTTAESWLEMQMKWDLAESAKDKKLADVVKNIPVFKKEAKSPAAKKVVKKPAAKTAKKLATKKPVAKKPGKPGRPAAK